MCVPLMRCTQPLVRALARPGNDFFTGGTFPELPAVLIDSILERWSPERVNFVQTHCMKRFEECVGDGVTTIEDPDKVFIARSEFAPDISVAQARTFGFVLPEDINERMRCNPNLRIKPLMVRCFGVGSGSTVEQILEGERNILSSSTDRLAWANALIVSHIESIQERFKSDPNVLVVPFITGFSLGGMFASTIAVKNNFPSIVFNGLGLGKTSCDFVGQENWARAQRQPNSHVAMFVDHDFVASPDSPWHDVTKTPGCIVRIPNGNPTNPTIAEMYEIHYCERNFDKAYQDYLVSHSHVRDRFVTQVYSPIL
ncbi:MAG: hypothetical protein LBC11_03190 [Puniceicoccales bacterium]|nr:hypothetical protein [Puniceicoccales bacterium]